MSSRRSFERLTRRRWTVGLTAAFVSVPLLGQVNPPATTARTPPQGAPVPAPASATPEQKLQKAYADVCAVSERLAKLEVPMDVEPAFAFRL